MIPLVRKPVMGYLIDILKQHGLSCILSDRVATSRPKGAAGRMKKIQDFSGFFAETFIVLCGGAWIDPDIIKALEILGSL